MGPKVTTSFRLNLQNVEWGERGNGEVVGEKGTQVSISEEKENFHTWIVGRLGLTYIHDYI